MAPELGLTARREWEARKLPAGESRAAEAPVRSCLLPPARPTPDPSPPQTPPHPGPLPWLREVGAADKTAGRDGEGRARGRGAQDSTPPAGRSGQRHAETDAHLWTFFPPAPGGHKGPVLSHDRWPVREDGGPSEERGRRAQVVRGRVGACTR